MAGEDGAALGEAGNVVVALVNEKSEGMYASDDDGPVRREAPGKANAHIERQSWMRHGPRYADPVDVVLADVSSEPGRRPGPDASPRGAGAGNVLGGLLFITFTHTTQVKG